MHETNENELVFEPAVRWAGNPHITVAVKILSARPIVQVRICLFFRRKTFATVMFFDAYAWTESEPNNIYSSRNRLINGLDSHSGHALFENVFEVHLTGKLFHIYTCSY